MADTYNKDIHLTYLNIRQSITILVAKIMLLDFLAAALTIGFYFILIVGSNIANYNSVNNPAFLSIFIFLGIVKTLTNAYIILAWLNEYYEITPEYIVHKHGIIFKKAEQYRLDHVRGADVIDSFLGEVFNFATITLYDIRLNKYLDMYLIHNARRYAKILKQLRPHLEMREDHVWTPIRQAEDVGIESEETT